MHPDIGCLNARWTDLLGQLVTSPIKFSTLLQDTNNLFQISQTTGNKQCDASWYWLLECLMDRLVATYLIGLVFVKVIHANALNDFYTRHHD